MLLSGRERIGLAAHSLRAKPTDPPLSRNFHPADMATSHAPGTESPQVRRRQVTAAKPILPRVGAARPARKSRKTGSRTQLV